MVGFEIKDIDNIIKNATKVMESSKYQVFEISEGARGELDLLQNELAQVMDKIASTIELVDKLERDFKRSRNRLSEVSRDFNKFKEEDIRGAYETATKMQMDLTIFREKETTLRARRDELQQRIRNIELTIERAETVVSQMNVVSEYLSGDLTQVTKMLETAKNRQMLGLRIIMAQEDERKRISREIHDGVAQSMAHLVLRTEIAERMMAKQEYGQVNDEFVNLKRQVRGGLEEVRKIIFNLRPMALDDLGLVPALRKFTQDFEERYKIHTRFDLFGKELRLQPALEIAVYRFVQEAFMNALKHAKAHEIGLDMTLTAEELRVVIKDDGIGIDESDLAERMASGNHFGVIGMKERVDMLDGTFEITGEHMRGTRIAMTIPIELRKEISDDSGE